MRAKPFILTLFLLVVFALTAIGVFAGPPASGVAQQATPRLVATVPPPTRVPTRAPNDDLSRVRAAGKIVVGTSLDNPPFSGYDDQFAPTGFDVALMEALAGQLGVKIEFNDFAFEGLLSALKLGQVDAAIAAISLTPQRLAEVDFTNTYYVGLDGLLARPGSTLNIRGVNDLAQLKVGVQRGSVYQAFLQETLVDTGLMPAPNLMAYIRPEEMVWALEDELLDVAMLDLEPARTFAARGDVTLAGDGLYPQVYAIAVRKGSALRLELNRALAALQARGLITQLAEEYLDAQPVTLPATPPATAAPIPTPVFTPTPVPCTDGLAYVADLNYDDRNMKAPPPLRRGQNFTKTWRVRNSGNCSWTADFALTYVRGNVAAARMGGEPVPVGRIVLPGQTIDISVPLTAPQAPGVYQGFWQMTNAEGARFGQTVWVGIRVPAPPTPTPPPPPPTAAGISFSADRTTINQGECVTFRWDVTNVKAVYFHPQGQPFDRYGVAGQASKQECPAVTTTYTLRVQLRDDQIREQYIQINVKPSSNTPFIVHFSSNPAYEVTAGACLNLWWEVRGDVSRVALVRNGFPLWDYAPVQGSKQDCPTTAGAALYELQAFGPGGIVVKAQRPIAVR
jgi:ABC-type amino acid transport substrate-binding protein